MREGKQQLILTHNIGHRELGAFTKHIHIELELELQTVSLTIFLFPVREHPHTVITTCILEFNHCSVFCFIP